LKVESSVGHLVEPRVELKGGDLAEHLAENWVGSKVARKEKYLVES
jgi:hypothetical protein